MAPPRYAEWLAHVFDHDVAEEPSVAWYFGADSPTFVAPDEEVVELITFTMAHSGHDLVRFSDAQVNQGLDYIFSNSCSNLIFSILDGKVGVAPKLRAIRSLERLYADCFAVRCTPALSHLDELLCGPLNNICYMLWDVTPLNYWEGRPERDIAYSAVVDVMESALGLPNIACVESALHGLGHTHHHDPDRIGGLVNRYLAEHPEQRPELLAYARGAAVGYVL